MTGLPSSFFWFEYGRHMSPLSGCWRLKELVTSDRILMYLVVGCWLNAGSHVGHGTAPNSGGLTSLKIEEHTRTIQEVSNGLPHTTYRPIGFHWAPFGWSWRGICSELICGVEQPCVEQFLRDAPSGKAFVFLDDNPAEVEAVRRALPQARQERLWQRNHQHHRSGG